MFIMLIVKIHWVKGWHWNWEKWAESAFNGCSWASALCDATQQDANFGTSPRPRGSDLTKLIPVGIRMMFNKKYFKVAAMKITQKKGLDVFRKMFWVPSCEPEKSWLGRWSLCWIRLSNAVCICSIADLGALLSWNFNFQQPKMTTVQI